jgi:carboxylesterase type B
MRSQSWLSLLVTVGQLSAPAKAVHCSKPLAGTINGTYVGSHDAIHGVDLFLGVPYAQPPIEFLRFQVPQHLNTSWGGRKKARTLGAQCVGYGVSRSYGQ